MWLDFKKDKNVNFKICKNTWWSFYFVNGLGWFRFFGIGLRWKDIRKHRMLFSERNGYKKMLKIGFWRISFLPYNMN